MPVIPLPRRASGAPPAFDAGDGGGDDGGMLFSERLSKIEAIIPSLATKADLATTANDIIKWMVGTAVGISVAAITIITFVLNNAAPKAAPATQPPAIIINVPSNQQAVAPTTSSASQP